MPVWSFKLNLQAMHPLNADGGTSQEQGTFHNPVEVMDMYLPEPIPNQAYNSRSTYPSYQAPKTSPPTKVAPNAKNTPLGVFQSTAVSSSKISTTLQAVLKGNLVQGRKQGRPTIFPTNASHANNPQKNPKKSYMR
jgi:hypothetical protein